MLTQRRGCVSEAIWAWLRTADLVGYALFNLNRGRRYCADNRKVTGERSCTTEVEMAAGANEGFQRFNYCKSIPFLNSQ